MSQGRALHRLVVLPRCPEANGKASHSAAELIDEGLREATGAESDVSRTEQQFCLHKLQALQLLVSTCVPLQFRHLLGSVKEKSRQVLVLDVLCCLVCMRDLPLGIPH